jgi:hypothetical protein
MAGTFLTPTRFQSLTRHLSGISASGIVAPPQCLVSTVQTDGCGAGAAPKGHFVEFAPRSTVWTRAFVAFVPTT